MFNQVVRGYCFSAWRPSALALLLFGLLLLNQLVLRLPVVDLVLVVAVAGSLLGIFASGMVQLITGPRLNGVVNLLALPIIGYAVVWAAGFLWFAAMFNDKPDNFGKDIVIPADMKVRDPVERFSEPGGPAVDALTDNIVAAFKTNVPASGSPSIATDLLVLNEFATANRQKLIDYLSASPRWFVTEERGKTYAYRRLVIEGRWQNSLNGFYGSFNYWPPLEPQFQTRIVIGFDGPVFAGSFHKIQTSATVGSGEMPIRVVDDKALNQGKASYLVLQSSRAAVEIFEQSRFDHRPATVLALAELKRELEMALNATATARAASGPGAFENRAPEIQLAKGMQGGIYHVRAYVNPGEAGRAYIKVFEATRNTPLSADRIKLRSIARLGWSTNPKQKFLYQSEVTVYEGDWGNFYPGRFECWFIPDAGGAERKLVDGIFRIEGWMR